MKLKRKNKTIDLDVWLSQKEYCKRENLNMNNVVKWVFRAKNGSKTQPIEILEVPELEMVLVRKKEN